MVHSSGGNARATHDRRLTRGTCVRHEDVGARHPVEVGRSRITRLDRARANVAPLIFKLEDASYVACEKSFDGRLPRTEYRLTAAGRRALEKYLAHMEAIIKAVKP